jgi:uncharacterized membrane protein
MMNFNLVPLIVLWSLLAISVIVMVVWRKMVASGEDDTLHVLQGSVAQQVTVANKLEMIDKWGKILTIVTVVSGVIIGALWVYQSYVTASNIPSGL